MYQLEHLDIPDWVVPATCHNKQLLIFINTDFDARSKSYTRVHNDWKDAA